MLTLLIASSYLAMFLGGIHVATGNVLGVVFSVIAWGGSLYLIGETDDEGNFAP